MAHHAEVDEGERPRATGRIGRVRRDEHVPRVRIGVEEARAEQLLEHHLGEGLRDLGGIDTRRAQPVDVVQLDRRHVGEGQHPRRRALPHDRRRGYAHPVREQLAEALGVDPLVQVVDLFTARRGELFDEGGHVDPPRHEPDAAQAVGDRAERGQVDLDDLVDARPLHLDDHLAKPRDALVVV